MARHWQKGVDLEFRGTGKYRSITFTDDAAYQLTSVWPKPEGKEFEAAVNACIKSLENNRSQLLADEARQ